jgi:hypothetical protein
MGEYVSKETLLKELGKNSITKRITLADGVSIYDTIHNIPTADVVEVKHGGWINGRHNDWKNNTYEKMCSVCGRYSQEYGRGYCPNCGAKMDGNNLSTIPTGLEGSSDNEQSI